jgi:hypothetical protein
MKKSWDDVDVSRVSQSQESPPTGLCLLLRAVQEHSGLLISLSPCLRNTTHREAPT